VLIALPQTGYSRSSQPPGARCSGHQICLQGLGKTVTCMALILKTLGQAASAPPGTVVHNVSHAPSRRSQYYEINETGALHAHRAG
jgi:hypothetical protein